MSLKHFHILFIFFAALFTMAFGGWALLARGLEGGLRSMGVFSLFIGVVLVVYGVWFVKKSRRVIT